MALLRLCGHAIVQRSHQGLGLQTTLFLCITSKVPASTSAYTLSASSSYEKLSDPADIVNHGHFVHDITSKCNVPASALACTLPVSSSSNKLSVKSQGMLPNNDCSVKKNLTPQTPSVSTLMLRHAKQNNNNKRTSKAYFQPSSACDFAKHNCKDTFAQLKSLPTSTPYTPSPSPSVSKILLQKTKKSQVTHTKRELVMKNSITHFSSQNKDQIHVKCVSSTSLSEELVNEEASTSLSEEVKEEASTSLSEKKELVNEETSTSLSEEEELVKEEASTSLSEEKELVNEEASASSK